MALFSRSKTVRGYPHIEFRARNLYKICLLTNIAAIAFAMLEICDDEGGVGSRKDRDMQMAVGEEMRADGKKRRGSRLGRSERGGVSCVVEACRLHCRESPRVFTIKI